MSTKTPVSIPPITVGYEAYADELKNVPLILKPRREVLSSEDYAIFMRSIQIPMKFTPCLTKYSWDPYMKMITASDVDRAKMWYKRTIEPAYVLPQQLMTLIEMRRKQQLSRRAIRRRKNQKLGRQLRHQQKKRMEQQQQEGERREGSQQQQQQEEEATPLLRDQQNQQFHLPLQECQKHHDPQQYIYSTPPYYTAPPPFQRPYNNPQLRIHQQGQYQSQIRSNRHHRHAQQQFGHAQPHHVMLTPQYDTYGYNQVMPTYQQQQQQQTHQVYYRYP